jgi:glutamate dehydrogenase
MRSNFHMRLAHDDFFIAFKINSLGVFDMPAPKPQYEIFVHAVDMQGIHLRAGKISRGGIRWSDRPDDFRTEILGLMQTQISKNALIIPTGAKGGFVLKQNGVPLDFKAAGKKAYLKLMHGLLDLTDNYLHGISVTPENIVAYDDADPYLVVAADKGTASFSDIANGVAEEYHFWLGDAFASGGSRGYDHKALGITARGAWECIKRHFRELGKDIQAEAFSVVGIGSMDGDVFGNGMLLSPFIRLQAAISGQHIFLDPTPLATEAPFNERQRLFSLAGSSWNDYNRALISAGGGVYARADKAIPISPELQKWLGIRYKSLDGEALIRYLLTAPVDLIWLGGIGTYVKASTEKHEDVGDRTNDNVRVDAENLRAKVVGEGANLGFTQKARIEYSLKGGLINTDAVDNSAGVDTSDHEVNLKILLTGLQKRRLIADYQALFIDMTKAVCELVLADNIEQSLCLSMQQIRSSQHPEHFIQQAEHLENIGFLDRAVESFPSDKEILARPGQTITRPELAALVSTSKRYLTQLIQNQIELLPTESYSDYLLSYFPAQIRTQFAQHLATHPLASAIKATVISNKIINQAGCEFLSLNTERENANILSAVDCYLLFDRVIKADQLRQAINALNNQIPAAKQYQLLLLLEKILVGFCHWSINHDLSLRLNAQTEADYSQYLADYKQYFSQPEPDQTETNPAQALQYQQDGIPTALAREVAFIASLEDFPFIVSLSIQTQQAMTVILQLHSEIKAFLGLSIIYQQLAQLPQLDMWQRKVVIQIAGDMQQTTGKLIIDMINNNTSNCASYFAKNRQLSHYQTTYQKLMTTPSAGLLPYVVLNKALEKLAC